LIGRERSFLQGGKEGVGATARKHGEVAVAHRREVDPEGTCADLDVVNATGALGIRSCGAPHFKFVSKAHQRAPTACPRTRATRAYGPKMHACAVIAGVQREISRRAPVGSRALIVERVRCLAMSTRSPFGAAAHKGRIFDVGHTDGDAVFTDAPGILRIIAERLTDLLVRADPSVVPIAVDPAVASTTVVPPMVSAAVVPPVGSLAVDSAVAVLVPPA